MKRVLTTGSYELIHHSHIEMLRRCKERGDYLIVGLSTDKFHIEKGKTLIIPYEQRKKVLEAIRYVDLVVPEDSFTAKKDIIDQHNVDLYCIGSEWFSTFYWVGIPVEYLEEFDSSIHSSTIKEKICKKS